MKVYTFKELLSPEMVKHDAAWLVQKGHAKTEKNATQALYTESAVEKFIIENPDLFGTLMVGPREEHPWEHDIKTYHNNEERIDVKSFNEDDPDKNCFSIGFSYSKACKAELPTKYIGTLISYINETVTVAYWQEANKIKEFVEENFDKYLSNNMAGYEKDHKYCLVPINEWKKI